jgi:hypothetical protein
MEPLLPQKEKRLFYKYLNNSKNYLEYGSGGSSFQASIRPHIMNIISVESDKTWFNKLKKIINNPRFLYNYIELNALPNTFGYPNNTNFNMNALYPSVIDKYKNIKFDLILIDGRFRVACALICFKYIDNNCILIVDDMTDRPYYNEIYNYYNKIDGAGRMVVFKKKDTLEPSSNLINKYINDPR